jgi:hypothetical protein
MTRSQKLDTIAALLAGRLYLEEFGWQQDNYGGLDGPACAIGTFYYGAHVDGEPMFDACSTLVEVIHANAIPAWNDAPGRTKRQVLNAFGRAVAKLEAEL